MGCLFIGTSLYELTTILELIAILIIEKDALAIPPEMAKGLELIAEIPKLIIELPYKLKDFADQQSTITDQKIFLQLFLEDSQRRGRYN